MVQKQTHPRHRRRMPVQQLSFLEPPPSREEAVPVWDALDEEQRARLVLRLARLIANTVEPTAREQADDRDE
jgi:hypothetical protein